MKMHATSPESSHPFRRGTPRGNPPHTLESVTVGRCPFDSIPALRLPNRFSAVKEPIPPEHLILDITEEPFAFYGPAHDVVITVAAIRRQLQPWVAHAGIVASAPATQPGTLITL
jgi:hypothetical protein